MDPPPTETPPSPPLESLPPPPPLLDFSPPPPLLDFSPPPPLPDPSPPPPLLPDPSPPPPAEVLPSPPPPETFLSPPPPGNEQSPLLSTPPPSDSRSPASPPPPPRQATPGNGPSGVTPPPPPPATSGAPDSAGSSSVAPIVIGVLAGLGLLVLAAALVLFCMARKKKKNNSESSSSYAAESPRNGRDTHQTWPQPTGSSDHIVSMNPPLPLQPMSAPLSATTASNDITTSSPFSGSSLLPPPSPLVALGFYKSTFAHDELVAATGGFSQKNLLGTGAFGVVHKGVLPNGKEIAVKSLKTGSVHGDKDFHAEVEIISRVHHRHLVSLVGFCISAAKKMLVYEFLPNNNLEFHLHEKGRKTILDWASRLKIAIGSAKGLAYLHEDCHPRIIHGNIKTSNILLDINFEAKVSDFGLAKLTQDNFSNVSTRIMGTIGYLAPEYASSGKLTDKSDVYAFGVVLLELITGRSAAAKTPGKRSSDSLVDWARPLCLKAVGDGNFEALADPLLERNYDRQEMTRMVACATAGIRHSAKRRPKLSQIVRALEGDMSLKDLDHLETEAAEPKPAPNLYFQTPNSDKYESESYISKMRKFKSALNSQEYASSEYGATSEYGVNPSSSSSDESSPELIRKGMRSLNLDP